MLHIDGLVNNATQIDNKWVIARPENYKYRSLIERIKDAWFVFTGRYEAIKFYKQ